MTATTTTVEMEVTAEIECRVESDDAVTSLSNSIVGEFLNFVRFVHVRSNKGVAAYFAFDMKRNAIQELSL